MKFIDGTVQINVSDLFANMTIEQKRQVAEVLVWDREIFNEIVEALASDTVVTESFNSYVYEARQKLMGLLPEMARNMVRSLMHEKKMADAECRRHGEWAWQLWHAWPREYIDQRPAVPKHMATEWPSDAEIDARIGGD